MLTEFLLTLLVLSPLLFIKDSAPVVREYTTEDLQKIQRQMNDCNDIFKR